MMVFEQGLQAHLKANSDLMLLVGSRIYPNEAPGNAPKPFVVYRRISNETFETLNDRQNLQKSEYTFTVTASSYDDMKDVSATVRQSLDLYQGDMSGFTVQYCKFRDENEEFDADQPIEKQLFTLKVDAEIWHESPEETVPNEFI